MDATQRVSYILLFLLLGISIELTAQENYKHTLDSLANGPIPELTQEVDISFNNIPLQELIRTLCNVSGINITISPQVNYAVNANFNKVNVKDVLDFLIEKYHLNISFFGKIIHLQPQEIKEEQLEINIVKDSLLDYNVRKTRADVFFQKLTGTTRYNFVLSPGIENNIINGYGHEISVRNALLQLALSNKLEIKEISPGLFTVSISPSSMESVLTSTGNKKQNKTEIQYTDGLFSADIKNGEYKDVLEELAQKAGYTLRFLDVIEKKLSTHIPYSSMEDFLCLLFNGSEYSYLLDGQTLWVGSRKQKEIKSFELIKLNNRRVDSLLAVIPKEMTQDLIVREFKELNSMLVWGDADKIIYLRRSLKKIDVVVPVILIDVIIIDATESFEIESGIDMGIGTEPTTTSGVVNPGLNYTMGASSVNKLLGTIGLTKLGKVTPNFYMKLKAMETDGLIDIKSTPQLATLNGHSATLAIGQTEYYKEASSNYWGSQTTNVETQYQYKPVEAKLGVSIKPIVAGNGQVTLNIDVEQSSFTTRIEETAPPGLRSKKFSSIIRVNNQEMILLGGLEEDTNSSGSKGWPLLSKIPILKWIFSSRTKGKEKAHLNIFIKPTVIY